MITYQWQYLFNYGKISKAHKLTQSDKHNNLTPRNSRNVNTQYHRPYLTLSWRVHNQNHILDLLEYLKRHPPRVPHKYYKLLILLLIYYIHLLFIYIHN